MYNQDELIEMACQEEREAQALWDSQFDSEGFHTYFSTDLDGEVMRCDNCGMNALGNFSKCDDYLENNRVRNAALRASIGL